MATSNTTQIIPPRVPLTDERTGAVSREWYRWFYNIYNLTGGALGVTPVTNGGTGLSTIPTDGQLLIGNGSGYTLNTLGAGAGIAVTNGTGTATIANTGVLSFAGGATGLTPAAATTGAVTLAGTLIAANGGTGFSSYAVGDLLYANTTTTLAKLPDVATGNALISGGVGVAPDWGKIGLTTHVNGVLPIANGGTNGSAAPTAGAVPYGTGTAYAFTAAGTAGHVLISAGAGVPIWTGTASININGTVGATTPAAGTFTSVTDSGNLAFTGTANRITGDFSNATLANRVMFQTATAGGGTSVTAIPNATGDNSAYNIFSSPDAANSSFGQFRVGAGTGDVRLTSGITGTGTYLPITVYTGGSEQIRLTTAGGVSFGASGTAYGTSGQVLTSAGNAPPTWTTSTTGTVTSVSFTGGIVSVATATTTPALTVAGTSGGIPYFSSASTWASSAVLATNAIVLGKGAGAAPATTTTGTGVVTALGVNTGTAGAFVVNGGALGTPSSGTVTNLTGTASININGTVGATTPAAGTFNPLTLSATPSSNWGIDFAPSTSNPNYVTLAAAATYDIAAGSGLVVIHSNSTGDAALFLTYGGVVVKIGGAASIVSGTGALNQIGLVYNGGVGKYRINNGYVTSQSAWVTTIRTRTSS